MRVYLVIIDETEEARVALHFAARRAARTNGTVHILALIPPQAFNAFGSVQATIEAEAHERAEVIVTGAAGSIFASIGQKPIISVRRGVGYKVVQEYLTEHPEVAALVLGAAREGNPGPLVNHFTSRAGSLPCPVFVIPGALSFEDIDRLS